MGRREARRGVPRRLGRGARGELFRRGRSALRRGVDCDCALRRADNPRSLHRPRYVLRRQGRPARLDGAYRLGEHRRGFRCGRGGLHHADRRAARRPDRREGARGHRKACAPHAEDGARAARRRGGNHSRGDGHGRRRNPRAAGRDDTGGRNCARRADLRGPVRDDGRADARRQGAGRRGRERNREPVRQLYDARLARGRGQLVPAHGAPRAVRRRGQGEDSAPSRPLGDLDSRRRAELGARGLARHGRGDTRRHDSRRLLPLRARARDAYRHHGGGG